MDPRLNPEAVMVAGTNYTVLSPNLLSKLWQPDPMVVNAKTTGTTNTALRLAPLALFQRYARSFGFFSILVSNFCLLEV
jgi:hypothetical protein